MPLSGMRCDARRAMPSWPTPTRHHLVFRWLCSRERACGPIASMPCLPSRCVSGALRLPGLAFDKRTQPARDPEGRRPPPHRLRILLAEDNKSIRKVARAILSNAVTSRDGKRCEEAVAAARDGDFDVILMDVQMPVLDGVQATARSAPRRPRTACRSSRDRPRHAWRSRAVSRGSMDDYLRSRSIRHPAAKLDTLDRSRGRKQWHSTRLGPPGARRALQTVRVRATWDQRRSLINHAGLRFEDDTAPIVLSRECGETPASRRLRSCYQG